MFGFLKKKKRTEGEQFLEGATDIHCHILPGVDDGFVSLSSSDELLARQEAVGVKRIYFTPHSMGFSGAAVDSRSYGNHHRHHHVSKDDTAAPTFQTTEIITTKSGSCKKSIK